MAFSAATFIPLSSQANSNAPRHYSYTTADAKGDVVASGYFDAKFRDLNVGDIIWSVDENGGTQTLTCVFIDAISAAGVVTTLSSTLTLS
jgi:hypothetical protein